MSQTQSIAVHLHLYYQDIWQEIKHYLANIGNAPYDLILKLHSKGHTGKGEPLFINDFRLTQKLWGQFLFTGLLCSNKLFNTTLELQLKFRRR